MRYLDRILYVLAVVTAVTFVLSLAFAPAHAACAWSSAWPACTVKFASGENLEDAWADHPAGGGIASVGAGLEVTAGVLHTKSDEVGFLVNLGAGALTCLGGAGPAAVNTLGSSILYCDGNSSQQHTAPLSSPVFTDDPQVPDQSAGDNDDSIANTEYVDTAVAAGGLVGDCTASPCLDGSSDGGTNFTLYEGSGESGKFDLHGSIGVDASIVFGRLTGAAHATIWHVAFLNRTSKQTWNGEQKFNVDTEFRALIPITTTGEYGDSGTNIHNFNVYDGATGTITHALDTDGLMLAGTTSPATPDAGSVRIYYDSGEEKIKGYDDAGLASFLQNRAVHTMHFSAEEWITDETYCAAPAKTAIPSATKQWEVSCADNDGSTAWGSKYMPISWRPGGLSRVGFSLSAHHPTAEVITCVFDVACQCISEGEAFTDTYTTEGEQTEISITTSSVANERVVGTQTCTDLYSSGGPPQDTGSPDNICDVSAPWGTPILPTICVPNGGGSCASGDILRWQLSMEAGESDANCADMNLTNLTMRYRNGGEDDY